MGEVIGDVLPLALGVAISPMPIIAVILMLLAGAVHLGRIPAGMGCRDRDHGDGGDSARAGVRAVEFRRRVDGGSGRQARARRLLLLLALKQWRSRPTGDTEPPAPKWLSALDSVTALKAVGLGFALAAVNPKNLLMILGAGVAIGQATLPVDQIVIVIAIFTIIAASTVAAPVIVYRVARTRAQVWLGSAKTWLVANNATVMMVLLAVIGAVLIGKGIGGL